MILKKLSLAILLTIYIVTAWSEKETMDMRETRKRGDEHFPRNNVGYREDDEPESESHIKQRNYHENLAGTSKEDFLGEEDMHPETESTPSTDLPKIILALLRTKEIGKAMKKIIKESSDIVGPYG